MAMDPIGTPRRSTSLSTAGSPAPASGGGAPNGFVSEQRNSGGRSLPVASTSSHHVQGLWDRFLFLKNTDNVKNNLLEEVLVRYSHLNQVFEEYKQGEAQRFAAASSSISKIQDFQKYEDRTARLPEALNRDAFATILIDGDSMIFNTDLLRLGEQGGKKAAYQLKAAAARYLGTIADMPANVRITARVYANVSGLASTCVRAGILSGASILEDFIRGFTQSEGLFDFVDVGYGKDRAGGKIVANFEHDVHNYQCRHILFGCSHDNAFAHHLEKYVNDASTMLKVTLLEGVPFDKGLATLPYLKKKLDGIFRNTKITLDQNPLDLVTDFSRMRHDSRHNVFNPTSAVFTPPTAQSPAVSVTPFFSPKYNVQPGSESVACLPNDLTRTNSLSSVALSEPPATGGAPVGGGWANIAKASAQLPYQDLTKKVASEPQYTGPVIMINEKGQRIDRQMDYDHNRVYELKQIKLCNQHYIGRGCCHYQAGNRNCPHNHTLKLMEEDKKWLRVVARETVCKKGTACRELDCIYGHHCPYPKEHKDAVTGQGGVKCINGGQCRFHKEMHGMDMKVHKILTELDVELIDA